MSSDDFQGFEIWVGPTHTDRFGQGKPSTDNNAMDASMLGNAVFAVSKRKSLAVTEENQWLKAKAFGLVQ